MRLFSRYAPPPRPRVKITPCRRNCCWTPYGHTPREGCTCHQEGND